MTTFNPNFLNLMRRSNFKNLQECVRDGVKLPAMIAAGAAIGGANEFVRINKDNATVPFEIIHFDASSRGDNAYYMYNYDRNSRQQRVGLGAMTLEELSARVVVNQSKQTQPNDTEKSDNSVNQTKESDKPRSKRDKINEEEKARFDDIEKNTEKTKKNGLTFADVGGQDKAITQMKRKILFPIKYPEAFKDKKISHGVVLYGPPGTGKSLLAETLANETKAHFIKLNGLEMISKWVGQSEENFRNLFKQAQEKQPAIIFIDEFDAVASTRDRERDPHGATVVNQILTLISDIEKSGDNIFVVTATNMIDQLDPAVIRSGRLETHIELLAPQTKEDVLKILDIHTRKLKLDDVNKPRIAEVLFEQGATGADIASIINKASEKSFERTENNEESIYDKMDNETFTMDDLNSNLITKEDFEAAIKEEYKLKNVNIKTLEIPTEPQ